MKRWQARGFALITALFLLVALSGLAAYLVNITSLRSSTAVLSVNAARAYQAAQSGLEWASWRVQDTGACASGTFTLTDTGFQDFSVSVTCSHTEHRLRDLDVKHFTVEVTASRGVFGSHDFVARSLSATLIGDS